MKIGDLVRFKHHGYLGVIVELGGASVIGKGAFSLQRPPWALVHWVTHPTLSRYQPQHDLEVVTKSGEYNENR